MSSESMFGILLLVAGILIAILLLTGAVKL
jgi:hypothetical protein